MPNSFDPLTLLFIGLTIFVIWRLRSVLGQKTGSEMPPQSPFTQRQSPSGEPAGPANETPGNVVRLPGATRPVPPANDEAPSVVMPRWNGIAPEGSELARGFDAIAASEPAFDAHAFLEGAKSAYEMIVLAFAKGDRKTLKDLLSRDVFEGFQHAIAEREKAQHTVETTFISLDKADILHTDIKNKTASITVCFVSKLISLTRDAGGQVIEGSKDVVTSVTDTWTFSRTLGSRDPAWLLTATDGEG